MKIPFLDLRVKDPVLKGALLDAVDRVLSHGILVLGPEVEQLETEIAALSQKNFAVGVASGTDALYLALRALGIGPGDEVITTPMSWIATLNAIVLCGATPRFVDIRPNMNLDESQIPSAITSKTKAILPVHWHGKLCNMAEVCRMAREYGLFVIEDAAQAIGAEMDGRRAGSFGNVNCFSMNAMKVWGAYGDAGAVSTDDAEIRDRLCSLRYGGTRNREDCHYPSLNARIDTLQAAMLLANLPYLNSRIERRREIARHYTDALCDVVECPEPSPAHVFYTYTIQLDDRDSLQLFLEKLGVSTRIRQPLLMTQQTAYRGQFRDHTPVAERVVKRILSLPIHQDLTQAEVEYVIFSIRQFCEAGG